MMRPVIALLAVLLVLSVVACSPGEPEFAKPAENAPVWELNKNQMVGNDFVRPPVILAPEYGHAG